MNGSPVLFYFYIYMYNLVPITVMLNRCSLINSFLIRHPKFAAWHSEPGVLGPPDRG